MSAYKRTIFLINPAFQLKFGLVLCSIIVLSSMIYPVIIYDFFSIVSTELLDVPDKIQKVQKDLIYYLIIIQSVITLLAFIIFIFLTHKIAGPMYKLKNHLFNIRTGHPITPLSFRTGDYFQDVAEEVSLFLDTIKSNQEKDFEYLEEISIYIQNLMPVVPEDKKPVLNEISRRLIDIQNRYKTDL